MTPDNVLEILVALEMSYGQRFRQQFANIPEDKLLGHWSYHLCEFRWDKWPDAQRYLHRAVNNGRVPSLADVVEACQMRARAGVAL